VQSNHTLEIYAVPFDRGYRVPTPLLDLAKGITGQPILDDLPFVANPLPDILDLTTCRRINAFCT
jgi:hypothetical protein